jgi:hypothetical protein
MRKRVSVVTAYIYMKRGEGETTPDKILEEYTWQIFDPPRSTYFHSICTDKAKICEPFLMAKYQPKRRKA